MLVRKVVLVVLAVTCTLLLASDASETPEFTREQEFRTRDGAFVVRSDSGRTFIVSLSNRSIATKSSDSSLEPCTTPLDPFEDMIQGEVRARYFESFGKLIVWGVRGSEQSSPATSDSRTVYYTMLLVDPAKCESRAVWLPDDRAVASPHQTLFLPEVLSPYPFSDDFDVYFASSQRHCSPCSFDGSSGRRRSKDRGPLEAEDAEAAGPVQLRWLESVEGLYGYFYAFNFDNGTAVVKLLGEDHRVRRSRYLEHPVDVVSVRNGRIRNVGYCYKIHGRNQQTTAVLRCDRLDSRLQSISPALVLPSDQSSQKVSFEYDAQGNFFIGVALKSGLQVYITDIFGETLADLEFGQLQDSERVRDLAAYFQDNQYCLFYSVEQQDSKANDANNIVKCIDTRKYIRNPV